MLQTVKSELNFLFFPCEQEAHQQRALRDSTVFFALDWVDSCPEENLDSPGQQADVVLILCDKDYRASGSSRRAAL